MKSYFLKGLYVVTLLLMMSIHVYGQQKTEVERLLDHYQLVWQDEFNAKALDTTKWNYRADKTKRNDAWVDGKKTISLDGAGHAVIKVVSEDGQYYVGQLSTDGLFNTAYGYYECRAKMNKGMGPHVAFWLQSPAMGDRPFNQTRRNGAEVDIFEYHRKAPDTVWQTIHINGYGRAHRQEGKKIYVPGIDSGFHTFGLLWTKDSYCFYIDGKKTWKTDYGISNRPQYMILSTELTGFGGNPALGHYPDMVIYDYVRVYKPL